MSSPGPTPAAPPQSVGSRSLESLRAGFPILGPEVRGRPLVYLDSAAEWVEPSLVVPEGLHEGDVVHVRRRWDPPDWVRGRVRGRQGAALSVELEDGGVAWTSLFRVRTPVTTQQVEAELSTTGEAVEPAD